MEGRAEAEGKSTARSASPAQDGKDALTHLQWIGKRAKEEPKEKFTNLLNHATARTRVTLPVPADRRVATGAVSAR